MASSTSDFSAPRRSASLPVQKPSEADPQTEVLYTLPSARIVQFQTLGSTSKRASSGCDSPLVDEEAGSLSWASRFESTIAVGPFRIYRAPSSVAFLHCQNALRPILPKSQCWVVDDDSSKLVLQIKKPQYWRIEVPNETPEDKKRTEELKEVLRKVLLFEKTPCPFQRNFVVELPEAPKTPIRKRPWKPVKRSKIEPDKIVEVNDMTLASVSRRVPRQTIASEKKIEASAFMEAQTPDHIPQTSLALSKVESREGLFESAGAKSSPSFQEDTEGEEDALKPSGSVLSSPSPFLEPSLLAGDSLFADSTVLNENDGSNDAKEDINITNRSRFQFTYQSMTLVSGKDDRIQQPLQRYTRSITAPPVLSLVTSPPSRQKTTSASKNSTIFESNSEYSSSVESFHSVQSWHSPLAPPSPPASGPPSPVSQYPYPHNNIVLPKRPFRHSRDVSELTVTPDTPRVWGINTSSQPGSAAASRSPSPAPKTPTLVNDTSDKSDEQSEIVTPPETRHRATTSSNSRRRELSPLPAAINLFSPQRRRSRHLQTARHIPTAIVQKTCEILLSPPSHLLQLMLSIASKIAAGEWRGVLTGPGESVHWDFEDEYEEEGWEDDFGISLPNLQSKSKGKNVAGGSWEVD